MGSVVVAGSHDPVINQIESRLAAYQIEHTAAEIKIYRDNPVSVRIRVVDPGFRGLDRSTRNKQVWRWFDDLSDEIQSDISMLVLLAPEEVEHSFANLEFNDPTPTAF